MIYQKSFYKAAIHRYSFTFSLLQANINLHLRDTVEIQLTDTEARVINALRGLLGKKAKLAMFKIFIDTGDYTYERLCELFPVYAP